MAEPSEEDLSRAVARGMELDERRRGRMLAYGCGGVLLTFVLLSLALTAAVVIHPLVGVTLFIVVGVLLIRRFQKPRSKP